MVWQKGYKLQGGRYVIEKVLGEGGFGITYQAQHTLLKQWVVIKTPNEILKCDSEYPNYVKRFIQEGRKLAQLSQQPHPNIVRVTELFEDGKTYCLVMDFVPGESLFNLVQKQGSLPELEAVGYIKQIGEALIFVHHQGLVHRDAHPGNIMVQKNGKAVLIDFGIAGEIMPQDGYFTSDHPANIAFAPYEQMGGNRQVTIDVYTLAASLYYAVTGKRPESSLDRKLYNKPLIPPNKYVVGISNELNLAILKGMNLEAENRPQSMREWLKLLPDFKSIVSGNKVYQFSNKREETTIKINKTYPTVLNNNLSVEARNKIKNIPWRLLRLMSLYYSIMGFLLASSSWYYFALAFVCTLALIGTLSSINLNKLLGSTWYITLAWNMAFRMAWFIAFNSALYIGFTLCFAVVLVLGDVAGSWIVFIPLLVAFLVFNLLNIHFIFACIEATKEVEKFFIKCYRFLILIGASWLGLFLGWLLYQFFPIFARSS